MGFFKKLRKQKEVLEKEKEQFEKDITLFPQDTLAYKTIDINIKIWKLQLTNLVDF